MIEGKYVILIPALNPNKEFITYVENILRKNKNCEILIVNDGSEDKYKFIFDKIEKLERCTVLIHAVNLGKGRALKTGFNYYVNNYNKYEFKGVITVDSDGQHDIEDVFNIEKKLLETKEKLLVIGARDFNEKQVPFKSKNGNKITSMLFKILYGKKISDTQTGLTYDFARDCISLDGERFEYEINMLIYAVNNHIKIVEQKIKTIYFNNNSETHFNPIIDSIKIYKVMFKTFFKFVFSSLSSAILDVVLFTIIYNLSKKLLNVEMRILLSTILARLFSSFYNYLINKNVVFKDNKNIITVVKYYMLCIVQLCLSWICVDKLYVLVFKNTHPSFLKILVDVILFLISYQIQRRWVFKRKDYKKC